MQQNNIAGMIDHTLLKAETTKADVIQLCKEAAEHQFASVCVNPTWVDTCRDQLKDSTVKVCTVIGFPLGANTPEVKAFETKKAIQDGATEVDMVINIGALKNGDNGLVERDIMSVVEAAKGKAIVKVIIETASLTEEEKVRACTISKNVGADYVKTSTGFGAGGATVEDIKLMRLAVGPELGVKASGGVRNHQAAVEMITAGATRIGTSNGIQIISNQSTDATTGY
jgi:deoxyribose-phosphate aldolase